MRRFARLYRELDESNRTGDKVAALERYLREIVELGLGRDGAWALFFLSGRRLKRVVNVRVLRAVAERVTGLPGWIIGESYEAVGDLSETLALLAEVGSGDRGTAGSSADRGTGRGLHEVVEVWMAPMARADEAEAGRILERAWGEMDAWQRLTFHKLISGTFRVGVQGKLMVRAAAGVAGVDAGVMAHRLTGDWEPTEAAFEAIMRPAGAVEGGAAVHAGPYPFCLANQLAGPVEALGEVADWCVERKWDGIRAQVIRREENGEGGGVGGVMVWSRGEEVITGQFPEVAAAARALPVGTVLDGEVLAWRGDGKLGRALPFAELQKRLGRKNVQAGLFDVDRVVFIAFDVLEVGGEDVRSRPLRERRGMLERVVGEPAVAATGMILESALVEARAWGDVAAERERAARGRSSEGVMLKAWGSEYHVGRVRGEGAKGGGGRGGWWKWKVDPFAVDAVLIGAQMGHGRRAGLYTDYTFGVWGEAREELTPFAKAYSGLTAEEIQEVDAYVRRNTVARMGPVRSVRPELVFEIGFEGIRESGRHKSGVAVRFPRILRWRRDKRAAEADTLERVRELLRVAEGTA